jgi:hypothetical protein
MTKLTGRPSYGLTASAASGVLYTGDPHGTEDSNGWLGQKQSGCPRDKQSGASKTPPQPPAGSLGYSSGMSVLVQIASVAAPV